MYLLFSYVYVIWIFIKPSNDMKKTNNNFNVYYFDMFFILEKYMSLWLQ